MTKNNFLVAGFVILVLAIVTSGAFLLSNIDRVSSLAGRLTTDENTQILNRATNVEAWCDGINDGRSYDRVFVAHVSHGQIVYSLEGLPCQELVTKTLESRNGQQQPAITLQSHPLTYLALHPNAGR